MGIVSIMFNNIHISSPICDKMIHLSSGCKRLLRLILLYAAAFLLLKLQEDERRGKRNLGDTGTSHTPCVPRVGQNLSKDAINVSDQPWLDPNSSRHFHRVTAYVGNVGLGNQLFAFASIVGIATVNRMLPVFPRKLLPLKKIFLLTNTRHLSFKNINIDRVTPVQKGPQMYDGRTKTIQQMKKDIQLRGYYHSWRYFEDNEVYIRKELQFKPSLLRQVDEFLSSADIPEDWTGHNVTRVGIHVRRGNFLTPLGQNFGYTVATAEFLANAMAYFLRHFPRVQFAVTSDDIAWCRTNIPNGSHVLYSEGKRRQLDLAISAQCQHMIVSTGTFSWWAGWLADGITVYYRHYPKRGSALGRHFVPEDYYPSHWIPMS